MQDNRIAASLGYALVRTFRAINRETNRKVRPLGLSSEQAHILMVLWLEGPLKVVSEDYSLFLEQVPGCYYFVGSRNEERGLVWGHHHQKFDIDEEAMGIGIETMTRTVLRYFANAQ